MKKTTPSKREVSAAIGADGPPISAAEHDDTGADDAPVSSRRRRREVTPAQRALALLVRREHSRPELQRKLVARGISDEDALAAVETMAGAGWQDDRRFAAGLARARAMNGYGPVRIEAELATHGLPADVVTAAFHALEEDGESDWPARALDLLERRFDAGQLAADPAARRKAGDYLLRRGFGAEVLRTAIRDFCGR